MFIVMACPRQISAHDFQLTVDILGETKQILISLYIIIPCQSCGIQSLCMFPHSLLQRAQSQILSLILCRYIYIFYLPNACKVTEFLSLLFLQYLGNANVNSRIIFIFIIWVLRKYILCFKTQNILKYFNTMNIHISMMNIILWLFITVTILKSN